MQTSYIITAILTAYLVLAALIHSVSFSRKEADKVYSILGAFLWPIAAFFWCWYSVEKLLKRWGAEKNNPHTMEHQSLLRLYLKTVQKNRLSETALADISDILILVKNGKGSQQVLSDLIQTRLKGYIQAVDRIDNADEYRSDHKNTANYNG